MNQFFYANDRKIGEIVGQSNAQEICSFQFGQGVPLKKNEQMRIIIEGQFTYGGNDSKNKYEVELCEDEKEAQRIEVRVVNAIEGDKVEGKRTTIITLESF